MMSKSNTKTDSDESYVMILSALFFAQTVNHVVDRNVSADDERKKLAEHMAPEKQSVTRHSRKNYQSKSTAPLYSNSAKTIKPQKNHHLQQTSSKGFGKR